MMIDSKVLREKLNNKELISWMDEDQSPSSYKQGYLSGLIKALAVLGEVEHLQEHGEDKEPVEFEFSKEAINGLTALTGAVSDKLKELELMSHSEKDIVNMCIGLMEDVHSNLMEYMEMMGVEHTEGIPMINYSYFEIVQTLLLSRTRHSGGTSTREKCEKLGFDSWEIIKIGASEEDDE